MKFSFVTPSAVGLALALSVGSADLLAQQPGQQQGVQVRKEGRVVQEAPGAIETRQVARVNVRTDRETISVGEDLRLQAEVQDAQGGAIYDRQVIWRSENPEIATVDQEGRVTAVSPGTATIVAEVDGQQQRTTITIREREMAQPGDTMPRQPMPGDTMPRQPMPGDTIPRQPIPGDTIPGEPMPGEPAPGEPLPEAPVVEVETEPVQWPAEPRARDLYWGIAGGANFPQGTAGDTYDQGWNVTMPFGWDPIENPWGARMDLSWNQLGGRTFSAGATTIQTSNAQVWSATLNGTLRLPMMAGEGRTGPYALAGVGLHHLRNFTATVDDGTGVPGDPGFGQFETENTTRFGWNAGAGFAFGVGGASLFVEGRYVNINTPGRALRYVPVVLGITF